MKRNKSQEKIARILSASVLLMAIIDIVMLFIIVGPVNGLSLSLNDPGKSFFHLCLLPLAVLIFFRNVPLRKILLSSSDSQKKMLALFAVLAVVFTSMATIKDHVEGFCSRISPPDAFADSGSREDLMLLYRNLHESLKGKLSAEDFAEQADFSVETYRKKLGEYRGENCEWRYVELSSIREKWSLALSFVASMFVVLLFWSLLSHLIIRKRPSEILLSAYLVLVSLLVPWLLLRAYSEWYLHFGSLRIDSYRSFYIGIILAILAAIILFILNLKHQVRLVTVSLLTGIPTMLSLVGALKPEWFGLVARIWYGLGLIDIIIIYGMLAVSILSVIWFLMAPPVEHKTRG